MLMKSWEFFVERAYEILGESDADRLRQRMEEKGITVQQILCYINYESGMSQDEIAKELDIAQPVVSEHISKLRKRVPELAVFNSRIFIQSLDVPRHDPYIKEVF